MSPSDDLLKLWARVERHLREALPVVAIDASTRRLTEEFLDHNELGLAFETLVGALLETCTAPTAEVQSHLVLAASEMGLQGDADWQLLNSSA
jgi:hypothetical protein